MFFSAKIDKLLFICKWVAISLFIAREYQWLMYILDGSERRMQSSIVILKFIIKVIQLCIHGIMVYYTSYGKQAENEL